ncbi:D-hexose-6-phosphate mutarotase [Nitrosomonas oligotropha]|uniref:Putative glucose-6-phosphate 1-epimerase n=1 Tax=Nitrosomonas oligotropha TaxID=42354 RepID=A0A1H8R7G5_9PROT|nr:D-hexose-6-phosphate mutarotase [Nitrosomonas oligotropha]SDW83863.1 glucose-6-phosphate 1-epimerase [Nitrosomonas oligotropha]SEO62291.1 glucose-6-phosphate 1-epimerase [Nitrosomonas oligotropha]
MTIEQLNTQFGIAGQLEFIAGNGGLPMIQVKTAKAKALISIHAGQVLSYQPAGEAEDVMFLSAKAYYQDGKAIKGGAPICWPWFGADPEGKGRPGHGFVRNRAWNVIATEALANGDIKVTVGLDDTPETQAIWPHAFSLRQEIVIGDSLNLSLITRNTGKEKFTITQAFHTYFKVGDISRAKVSGLAGCDYLDKAGGGNTQKHQTGDVTIDAEVDRIYLNVGNTLTIDDAALNRCIQITSQNSKTAVVWNPWEKIAKDMADLEDHDYQRLLCVETTNAADDVREVAPGGECRLVASYRVVRG